MPDVIKFPEFNERSWPDVLGGQHCNGGDTHNHFDIHAVAADGPALARLLEIIDMIIDVLRSRVKLNPA